MDKVKLSDIDFEDSFFHFTHVDSLDTIEQVGLGPRIGKNSDGVEDTEKVFFSKGYEGVVELFDVWIKWLMNKSYSDINLYNFYEDMDIEERKRLQSIWAEEFLSRDYLQDEEKKRWIYDIIYKGMHRHRYLTLDLCEGLDYSVNDIDENKRRNLKKKELGNISPYLFEKEMYGSFSNPDSEVMDKWNMHTFVGQGVSKEKIKQIIATNGDEDILSILLEVYNKYKRAFPNRQFDILDNFIHYAKERRFAKAHNISLIQSVLNKKAHEYLRIINDEYSKFFNDEQRSLMNELLSRDCIVVESDSLLYVMNQHYAINNDDELTPEEKKEEIKNLTIPLAHGGRVFNDNKIHFYPALLFDGIQPLSNEFIIDKCSELIIHELLHFFIRPAYINVKENPSLKKVNNFMTEGLVDMTARDLMRKYGLFPTYNSAYGSNVLCTRELLSNLADEETKIDLVFQSSIEDILNHTSNEVRDSRQIFINYINKDTEFDKVISRIAYIASKGSQKYESIKRFLYNFVANFQSKEDALFMIDKYCQDEFPEISPLISKTINEYYQRNLKEEKPVLS